MIFLVTYAVVDGEYGNPFWHAFLMLSVAKPGEKIEAVDSWGFYGVPSTPIPFVFNVNEVLANPSEFLANGSNHLLRKLKIAIGLDIDFKGNHGFFRHEDTRFLDTGSGLHGLTFIVSEDKFNKLRQKCVDREVAQQAAIDEAVKANHLESEKKTKFRIYPYEHKGRVLNAHEQQRAKQTGEQPRLKPFELIVSFNPLPALNQSKTCKSDLITDLLADILTKDQIDYLTENGKHPTIPRLSGELENIYLHSSGPLKEHVKHNRNIVYSSGLCNPKRYSSVNPSAKNKEKQNTSNSEKHVFYRDHHDPSVKLHWTLPPQLIATTDKNILKLFTISPDYCDEVKKVIHQLQKIEWLFINAELPKEYKEYREKLIEKIRSCYEAFSIPTFPEETKPLPRWIEFCRWTTNTAKNVNESLLLEKLERCRLLMNDLDFAIAHQWKIYDDLPMESLTDSAIDENPLEALAAYLQQEDQQKLCSIVGRGFTQQQILEV